VNSTKSPHYTDEQLFAAQGNKCRLFRELY